MKEQALFYKINWRLLFSDPSKMLNIPFWNGPNSRELQGYIRHSREPPLFIFMLQINKILKENDISFGHQSTSVANIEREESEQA